MNLDGLEGGEGLGEVGGGEKYGQIYEKELNNF